MTLVQIAEVPRLVDPQLSPDGKSVAYMLATADWTAGQQAFHLWRQSTAGGAPVALTSGSTSDAPGSTRWSPDGSSVLFGRAGQLMLLRGSNEPRAEGVTPPGGRRNPVDGLLSCLLLVEQMCN